MHHATPTTPHKSRVELLRRAAVCKASGYGSSSLYENIAKGLFVPAVKLVGTRAVGWPSNEVDAVVAATIAGVSEDEMRRLVAQLVAGRKAAH